jgi:hypothetical protein
MARSHSFMSNPYIGGFPHGGRTIYFILSESSIPLMRDDQMALFSSAEEAQDVYARFLYTAQKAGKAAPKLMRINFTEKILAENPQIATLLAETLGRPDLAPHTVDAFGAAATRDRQGRMTRKVAKNIQSNASRGGYTWGNIKFAQYNLNIGDGNLGPAAKRAYDNNPKETRITEAYKAAGITPKSLDDAQKEFLKRIRPGMSKDQKNAILVSVMASVGIPFQIMPKAKKSQGAAATGAGASSAFAAFRPPTGGGAPSPFALPPGFIPPTITP